MSHKVKAHILSLGILLLFPFFLFAQQFVVPVWILSFLGAIQLVLNTLIPIMITLALVVFFWGLIKFIASAGDEEGRKKGRQVMVWGVIILAVMISIWGIVALIQTIFGVGGSGTPKAPGLPGVEPSSILCPPLPKVFCDWIFN